MRFDQEAASGHTLRLRPLESARMARQSRAHRLKSAARPAVVLVLGSLLALGDAAPGGLLSAELLQAAAAMRPSMNRLRGGELGSGTQVSSSAHAQGVRARDAWACSAPRRRARDALEAGPDRACDPAARGDLRARVGLQNTPSPTFPTPQASRVGARGAER